MPCVILWTVLVQNTIIEPEDKCELYLLDMNIAKFLREWELAYDSISSAFRSSQGCLDLIKWYDVYEAKFIFPMYKNFGARYRYRRIDDYGINHYEHRIEPYLKLNNLWLFLEIIPYFYKYSDEVGFGVGYIKNWLNYVEFFIGFKDFDRNFASRFTPPGPDLMVYYQIPFRFQLYISKINERLRLKIKHSFTTQGTRIYRNPLNYRTEKFDSLRGGIRLEVSPLENLWLGCMFQYAGERRIFYYFIPEKKIGYDTLFALYIEPFVEMGIGRGNRFLFEYTFFPKIHRTDTSSYVRDWKGMHIKYIRRVSKITTVWAGYQISWRKRVYNGVEVEDKFSKESRLIFSVEFNFASGVKLIIHEGIEMDGPISWRLKHPHNHTYVSLFVPIKRFDAHNTF